MTEEEALSKWCPFARSRTVSFARASAGDEPTVTVWGVWDPTANIRCIGSACMAWRWTTVPNPDWKPQNSMLHPAPNPYTQPPSGIPSTTHGGCGLSGAPQ